MNYMYSVFMLLSEYASECYISQNLSNGNGNSGVSIEIITTIVSAIVAAVAAVAAAIISFFAARKLKKAQAKQAIGLGKQADIEADSTRIKTILQCVDTIEKLDGYPDAQKAVLKQLEEYQKAIEHEHEMKNKERTDENPDKDRDENDLKKVNKKMKKQKEDLPDFVEGLEVKKSHTNMETKLRKREKMLEEFIAEAYAEHRIRKK